MTTVKRTSSDDAGFLHLVTLLDRDLAIRDGDETAFYAQFNKLDTIRHAVVAYSGDVAVGCGAFKAYESRTVEIKRMYVLPAHRGKGIAAGILKELEAWAAEVGYNSCVLESGKKQPEAIALYQKSGYGFIPNYGQYENVVNSVCMGKII